MLVPSVWSAVRLATVPGGLLDEVPLTPVAAVLRGWPVASSTSMSAA
ncbi:hypothetical protein [Teichococcus vastitatis]|uniref:Uncharacterized protein n=1 Tax=Teichococcus vastitatis TaxID=2307076 RepID=A0ABS9WCT6_9PROT|nr:hypothetical protein [Pseudoroseomonas vastitatis]MCI0757107.1 hypothetical protein [Pseudoroseomonas vastitatis]